MKRAGLLLLMFGWFWIAGDALVQFDMPKKCYPKLEAPVQHQLIIFSKYRHEDPPKDMISHDLIFFGYVIGFERKWG